MIVDFHTHFYPPAYLDALRAPGGAVRVTDDAAGNPVIHYPGDYNVAVPGHRDIDFREGDVTRQGADLQVLSLTTPGVHVEEAVRAITLARLVNDAFAKVARERSRHFTALATLPLNDPAASAAELRRAMGEHGFKGAMVFSNVNGVPLADQRFEPLWATANELGAIIHIHPTNPVNVEAMSEYWLMPLVGFLFDTTLAAANLVFAGVPARYPRIAWVLGHLGGAIPYLAERLDRGHAAFAECRRHIDRKPSEYLREFYFDTVNFDPHALKLAVEFAGAKHILAGSDYPHAIGSIPMMRAALGALDVPEPDRQAIFGGNARRLLGL
jgi:aminocarboxymuconate-semialdehyde decarboxylase